MKVALIFPPTCDPTAPCIALPSLTAWLRSLGMKVVAIKANLQCTECFSQPQNLKARLNRIDRHWSLHHYPGAGSLSTAHTLLWCERFGRPIFKQPALTISLRSGAQAPVLPRHVRTVAQHAFRNEANLWYMLVYGKPTVTQALHRQLAEDLPVLSVPKTRRRLE